MMYGWPQHGWGPGMWIVMVVAMVLFWSLVVFGIVMLMRRFGTSRPTDQAPPNGAEETLRARFARGEIDEEEFTRRLKVLRGET